MFNACLGTSRSVTKKRGFEPSSCNCTQTFHHRKQINSLMSWHIEATTRAQVARTCSWTTTSMRHGTFSRGGSVHRWHAHMPHAFVDPTAFFSASVRPSPPTPGDQTRLVTIRAPDGPARCLHRRGVLGARPPHGGLTTKGGQYGAGPTARSRLYKITMKIMNVRYQAMQPLEHIRFNKPMPDLRLKAAAHQFAHMRTNSLSKGRPNGPRNNVFRDVDPGMHIFQEVSSRGAS